jgi:hypothetical protein
MSTEPSSLADIAREYWTPPEELIAQLPRAGVKLSYVGHADVNRTLTEIDPGWSWEPLAFTDGVPYIHWRDKAAVLWGRLTLLGKPVICVGSCDPTKADVEKELVGDLIRNGAMRHNVYGALWSKAERDGTPERDEPERTTDTTPSERQEFRDWLGAVMADHDDMIKNTLRVWLANAGIDTRSAMLSKAEIATVRAEVHKIKTTEPWEDVGSGDASTREGEGSWPTGVVTGAESDGTSPDPAHVAEVVESIEAQVAAAKARRAQDRVAEVASKGTKP